MPYTLVGDRIRGYAEEVDETRTVNHLPSGECGEIKFLILLVGDDLSLCHPVLQINPSGSLVE